VLSSLFRFEYVPMSVFAIVIALLVEQWPALGERKGFLPALSRWAIWVERNFNGGEMRHGIVAWLIAVGPAALIAIAVHALLAEASSLLALAFDVVVLYYTIGFRQYSHYFTDIQLAIKTGEIERARELISQWRGEATVVRSREEIIRLTIEEALVSAHRQVFGGLLWYVLLPGPSGAILYRLACFLCQRWGGLGTFGRFAQKAFSLLDWPAVRLSALVFAVVGDFEDAVYCWRTQARGWPEPNAGVVLASGAGAMGVKLGMPIQCESGPETRAELGVGETADSPFLESTVGLLWRSIVFWVFLLILVSVARLLV
jgi:cobalamin biosynthesis protein CobD/CbiB